jgi:hypothetical protein
MRPAERDVHSQLPAKPAENAFGCAEKLLSDCRLSVLDPFVNEAVIAPVNTASRLLNMRDSQGNHLQVKPWREVSSAAGSSYFWLKTGARWLGALVPYALTIGLCKGALSARTLGDLSSSTIAGLKEEQTATFFTRDSLTEALAERSKTAKDAKGLLLSSNPYGQFWTDVGDAGENFLIQQRQRLIQLLKQGEPQILNALDSVEQRSDIAPRTLGKIYQEICALVDGPERAPLARKPRALALDVLDLVADPANVCQGHHPTCAVASLEYVTYAKLPENAVGLVTQVAKSAKYKCADGSSINLTGLSLQPELTHSRSHASQIFQNTGVNVFWQRQTEFRLELDNMPAITRTGEKGFLRYEPLLVNNPAESPYRLLDYSKVRSQPVVGPGDGYTNFLPADPYMNCDTIDDICAQINGRMLSGITIDPMQSSAEKLSLMLRSRKVTGKLPAIANVHTGNAPFNIGQEGNGDWHSIVVTDYDHGSGIVSIFNPWGKDASPNRLYLQDLWRATHQPARTI